MSKKGGIYLSANGL